MTTVVELGIPADRLGLAGTFDRVSTFEFRIKGTVGDSPPLVWTTGPDRDSVGCALESDPSVEVIASVAGDRDAATEVETDDPPGDRWLYRLAFGDAVKLFEQLVTENGGAILAASGRDRRWTVKLLFHDRESVSTCHEILERYEFETDVTRISGVDDLSTAGTPLTETQYETICKAHELGYFDVPRGVTLEELASELDVSHQALSERLRRSHAALVSAELSQRTAPITIDP